MTYIIESLINGLQNAEYPCKVNIRDFYKVQKLTPPLVAIQELPSNDGVYLDNQPAIVMNTYQVETYAKAKTIDGKAISGIDLAKQIAKVTDDYLNTEFGLTMSGSISVQPYEDTGVTRLVARYTAYIDTRTNNIYRRS
jgi:hypothetical protein